MYVNDIHKVWLATSDKPIYLQPAMANRHGLIAGATGTGKTVTLKVLAESFSDMGVPVFVADIKGDLSGMCARQREQAHPPFHRYHGLGGFPVPFLSRSVLGCVRQAGHPRPYHHL